MNTPMASVYGLFDETGRCIYVGCTSRPTARRKQHEACRDFEFMRIFRTMPKKLALAEEKRLITALKSIGEAQQNGCPPLGVYSADKWAHIRINPQNQKRFIQWRKTNPYASSLCYVANVALAEFFDRSLSKRFDLPVFERQMEKEPK